MKTVKQLLSQIKKDYMCLRKGKPSSMRDYKDHTNFIRKVVGISLNYAHVLGFTQQEVLNALENNRTYWSANYYGNMYRISKNVHIFETIEDFQKMFPSKKYICPKCKGISNDPYVCDTKLPANTKSGICDWKAYGLFGCLGGGYSFIIKSEFLNKSQGTTIFKPIELDDEKRRRSNKSS